MIEFPAKLRFHHSGGGAKDWECDYDSSGVTIRYGKTDFNKPGKGLRSTHIPLIKCEAQQPYTEARKRVQKKLDEGYEPIIDDAQPSKALHWATVSAHEGSELVDEVREAMQDIARVFVEHNLASMDGLSEREIAFIQDTGRWSLRFHDSVQPNGINTETGRGGGTIHPLDGLVPPLFILALANRIPGIALSDEDGKEIAPKLSKSMLRKWFAMDHDVAAKTGEALGIYTPPVDLKNVTTKEHTGTSWFF